VYLWNEKNLDHHLVVDRLLSAKKHNEITKKHTFVLLEKGPEPFANQLDTSVVLQGQEGDFHLLEEEEKLE